MVSLTSGSTLARPLTTTRRIGPSSLPQRSTARCASLALTDFIANMSGGARVNDAVNVALDVLRHMRRDVRSRQALTKPLVLQGLSAPSVRRLPGPPCRPAFAWPPHARLLQPRCWLAREHQAMALVRHYVAQVAGQCRRCTALAVQTRLRIAVGFVRGVAAGSPCQSSGRVAIVRSVLVPHALVAGPGLDQRAVQLKCSPNSKPRCSAIATGP
jgi:hypothetical protein